MKILLAGCSGFIGTNLNNHLSSNGHTVCQLVRSKVVSENEISWDPATASLEPNDLENFDVVIHLGGVNVAEKRWNDKFKRLLESSRVDSTTLLAQTLKKLTKPPKQFICASAIGYYGDRGPEVLDEQSEAGTGFFPELCQKWEAACQPAKDAGIKVAHLRIGIVLGQQGALSKMKLPFSLGLGGVLGSGSQYWSWISIEDVVRAVVFTIENQLTGPVNIVAPTPVTNKVFTKSLGRALKRPTIFPVPSFILRLIVGEFADEGLLSSARVIPQKLIQSGFEFKYKDIDTAMKAAVV